MGIFTCITVNDAYELLNKENTVLVDIRDPDSFAKGHINHAFLLNGSTMEKFLQSIAFDTPVLVLCYHGNSSKNVAQYLYQQGYKHVYSIDGGFQKWQCIYPKTLRVSKNSFI